MTAEDLFNELIDVLIDEPGFENMDVTDYMEDIEAEFTVTDYDAVLEALGVELD